MSDQWIRASEIADYVYCNRSWWLRRVGGHTSTNVRQLAQGMAYHEQHGRGVRRAQIARRLVYVFLIIAAAFLIVWVVQGF